MTPFAPLLILCAGALSVLAYAPFNLVPLVAVSLALLFASWRHVSPRRAAWLGACWGVGAFFAGIGWLVVALNRFGGMPLPLAVIAILLLSAFLALYPALVGAAFAALRSGRWVRDALLVAALWALAEWLRGWLLTGFPWLAVGYTQTPPSPLAGFAPVLGVYGLGALVAFIAALFGLAPDRRGAWLRAAVATGVLLAVGAGLRLIAWSQPVGAPLRVALLQPAIPQDAKWDAAQLGRWLDLNLDMVRVARARLVVLPETTLPVLAEHLPPDYLPSMGEAVRVQGGEALLGVFTRDPEGRIYNAAVTVGGMATQHYAKRHLVPFGEYSPPLFGWFYALASIPMSDQTRGHWHTPIRIGDQRIAVNICYEDLFGEELIGWLPEATLMLNLSNLAWYGDSHAQPQHLQIARMRALETARPMLRSTNTGMTAWIEPDGRVASVLPAFARGMLTHEVRGYAGMTPYARWGNWPVVSAALTVVALILAGRFRRSQR